nr:coiled-coil domain-containing protein 146 [Salvelinus alpinus]
MIVRSSWSLTQELSECKERMLELEKALEDPGQENRARELEGNDPSPVELIQKIEQLEVGLAEREELLLEKDLVFEQVTRLSQRIRAKAENGKQDTLQLAKKQTDSLSPQLPAGPSPVFRMEYHLPHRPRLLLSQ